MKNIYLIGMMGSGKTQTARELAGLLNWKSVDLDALIVEKEKMNIDSIFQTKGEDYFRDCETAVLENITQSEHQVVATGGGVVINKKNRELMKSSGLVLYLEASMDTLWSRVKNKTHRPLLNTDNPKEKLEEVFRDRKVFYESAEHQVNTDGKKAKQVAGEIQQKISSKF